LVYDSEKGALVLHRDIAMLIRGRTANDRDIRRNRTIIKPFLTIELNDLDYLAFGEGVHFPAVPARIYEGIQPYFGQHARPSGGSFTMHVE
jgi:hypothetical protein